MEESQPTAAPEETQKSDEHVKLNLNYSRLGVATKVDTYLNVRKKPSENSKIVGKMTKNAGCHIYKIKKAGQRWFRKCNRMGQSQISCDG